MKIPNPSTPWSDLPPIQRNNLIGHLIGAEPLQQIELLVEGRHWRMHNYDPAKLADFEALLAGWQKGDRAWKDFKQANPTVPDDWRGKITAGVYRWHARYSDTPGGGWMVVEALRKKGYGIEITSRDDGWCVLVNDAESKGIGAIASTMQEAVCEIAVALLAPAGTEPQTASNQ